MALPEQRRILERWMCSKAIVQYPACGDDCWRFAEAVYIKALLKESDANLIETGGAVKLPCGNCGYVIPFDVEQLDIRRL